MLAPSHNPISMWGNLITTTQPEIPTIMTTRSTSHTQIRTPTTWKSRNTTLMIGSPLTMKTMNMPPSRAAPHMKNKISTKTRRLNTRINIMPAKLLSTKRSRS